MGTSQVLRLTGVPAENQVGLCWSWQLSSEELMGVWGTAIDDEWRLNTVFFRIARELKSDNSCDFRNYTWRQKIPQKSTKIHKY